MASPAGLEPATRNLRTRASISGSRRPPWPGVVRCLPPFSTCRQDRHRDRRRRRGQEAEAHWSPLGSLRPEAGLRAELKVRIHFPPAVSQTNFRIAPLARPDFVERQPMCCPIRRLIIRAGWRALDFRSGTTELCGIRVGAPRRRRRRSAPWRVSPWLADFVQDGRFWRRIAERSLYAEVMGQSAVRRSSVTLKWRAAPMKSRRDWLVALPAQVRVENGRVGNRNRREWRAPHRGNPCSPLSGTPPRARPLR